MRFKSLGSGSSGNAAIVEVASAGSRTRRLLVDCGLGIKQLESRLAAAGLQLGDIDAVFITHEHSDHIGCAPTLCTRFNLPVWMSYGTYVAIGSPVLEGLLHLARDGETIDLGALQVTPFTVPHDAKEPLQLTCTDGNRKLAFLTDLGHATPHVLAHLANCDALLLECNHDTALLAQSRYPAFLKRRVGGSHGHLSNDAAAEIARSVQHCGLQYLVASHLSEQNNRPDLARQALATALTCHVDDIVVADAKSGSPWLSF